jgi:hypothetical protein
VPSQTTVKSMQETGGNGWIACRVTVPHRQSNDLCYASE